MSPFEIFVEDGSNCAVGRHRTSPRTELFDRSDDPQGAQMRLRETGASVVHMNGSGGIENVFDTTSSVYGDSP